MVGAGGPPAWRGGGNGGQLMMNNVADRVQSLALICSLVLFAMHEVDVYTVEGVILIL